MLRKKTLLVCISRQNKGTDIFYDQSVQVFFSVETAKANILV